MSRFRSQEFAAGWLSGMIDGEGSVYIGPGRGRYVKIASTDHNLVDATIEALAMFDIDARVQVTRHDHERWADLYNVVVERRELVHRLRDVVDLQHMLKSKKLAAIGDIDVTAHGAHNAAKTHCPHGHPYDEANTYVYNNQRFCRACNRAQYHQRKRRAVA